LKYGIFEKDNVSFMLDFVNHSLGLNKIAVSENKGI